MERPASSDLSQALTEWVRRVSRPIEFASRDDCAHVGAVRNLGSFVAAQVLNVLSARVYPAAIESRLLELRELFVDLHAGLSAQEQKRRLERARAILGMLKQANMIGADVEPASVGKMMNAGSARPSAPYELWRLPIRFAKGVGPKRAAALVRIGVETVEQALWCLPWRYEDRSRVVPIVQLKPGLTATVCGTVVHAQLKSTRRRGMTVLEVVLQDRTGRIRGVFFNRAYLDQFFVVGAQVMWSGSVDRGRDGGAMLQMDVQQYDVVDDSAQDSLHVGRIVPIYHETKGWTSRQMRALVHGLLHEYAASLEEPLPVSIRAKHGFPGIEDAIRSVHFPDKTADLQPLERGLTRAHRRLAFEELFVLQAALAQRQRQVKDEVKGIRFDPTTPMLKCLSAKLPFKLTAAQDRVVREILRDMAAPRPMNRLIQGDVGSGKTVVALHAIVVACGSGYQAALMAPTEILADQHARTLRPLLEAIGITPVVLTSGARTSARGKTLADIAEGRAQVVIGTHAIIQKGVQFSRLGLAVVDEQHKFGVLQRKTLTEKGYHPDVLVMTATPIPRTLAMTVYGDLDVSVIDVLPPGRKPVKTWLFGASERRKAYQLVVDQLKEGRQAYVVFPLIEESEKVDLKAAIQAADRLQREEFAGFRVGLLHGRLASKEKDRTMAEFKAGTIQVLVATTVVEVGVDVPNASVMLVEHAERFGLAQLHQLRGRVGRGGYQSHCVLLTTHDSQSRGRQSGTTLFAEGAVPSSRQRLEALVRSNDGFVIAEEDLKIRGPGEFLGVRQWGMPEFRAANLVRDADLLQRARQEAFALVQRDPALSAPVHRVLRDAVVRRWRAKLDLGAVS
jgi:ATP-dependent DNA helicase RecG